MTSPFRGAPATAGADRQPQQGRRRPMRAAAGWACLLALSSASAPARAEGQVQLSCSGTLLEARGQAEQQRRTARLQFSLGVEAEAADADAALGLLQRRLAAVRSALQERNVQELRISSPSSWQRPAEGNRPASVQANLQVSGALAPAQLQGLIRGVGALPGVRLAPVGTEADRRDDARVRQDLLKKAYDDARQQVQPLAALIGRPRVRPLEIRVDGTEMPVMAMRAMAADSIPPFNPDELSKPRDRLSMQVRFCAE